MQLAQLNIAESRFPMSDPHMVKFTDKVDAINAVSDRSSGFVWRLTDDNEDIDGALSLRLPGNETTLVNMSVWENLKSLYAFVYKTAHAKIMQVNHDNFLPLAQSHFVLWWINDGHIPNLSEAKMKLEQIRAVGSTYSAFNFKDAYNEDGTKSLLSFTKKGSANV